MLKRVVVEASRLWWTVPIAGMGAVFAAFFYGYVPFPVEGLAERGQFGDSFGVLNSLFTGLGFGGLVVTLLLQQKQLRHQENQMSMQHDGEARRHYEETLHRLLSIYSNTLGQVSNVQGTIHGRTVLRMSSQRALDAIKAEGVQHIPHTIQTRYDANALTPSDKVLLDYLYFRNFKLLSVEIDRQGRLIETFKVLLDHLVNNCPTRLESKSYSALVMSQLTYVEITYFFLVALCFSKEEDLRLLMKRGGLLQKAAQIHRLKIHDYMYEQFWGVAIKKMRPNYRLPIDDQRINHAIRAYKAEPGRKAPQRSYTSPRVSTSGRDNKAAGNPVKKSATAGSGTIET